MARPKQAAHTIDDDGNEQIFYIIRQTKHISQVRQLILVPKQSEEWNGEAQETNVA